MNRTMTLRGFILLLGLILIVFLILHSILRGSVDEQTRKEQELRVRLTRLEEENKDLLSRLNMAGTDEYIMANAVRKYSYVKRDAIRFEYTNPEAIYAYSEKELQILMDEMSN